MVGGDAPTAMGFLEVALDARASVFGLSHGIRGFAPLNYLDAVPLWDAAAASRPDLIDRAIALEEANRDADGGGEGRYDRRIAAMVRVRESIPFLEAIRGAVERDPGIRQINLTPHCPGADNAKVSRLVGQLASAGVLVKERISSRVCVWPAGHPGIPAGEQRMAPGDAREMTPEEFRLWCADPEQAVEWAQQIIGLLEQSRANPDRKTTPVPQPLDLHGGSLPANDAEGNPCSFMDEPDEMVVWGHVDDETMRRILGRYVEHSGVPSRRRRKWQAAEVRRTYLERVSCQGREGKYWMLQETEEASGTSAPVTAIVSPVTAPHSRPAIGQITWLGGR